MLKLILIFALTPVLAYGSTAFDQILGIRISQLIAREILGSPPLPSLEEKRKSHFSPRGSYISVKADNTRDSTNAYDAHFQGKLTGWSAGAAFTQSSKINVSVYVFGTFTRVRGSINVVDAFGIENGIGLKDMNSTGANLSAGLSYRLWSKKTFPLVVGVLAGPYVSYFRSTFKYQAVSTNQNNNYKSNSFVYGPSVGVQAFLDVFNIQINPYFLKYFDVSDPCQTYETDNSGEQVDPNSAKSCSVSNKEIYLNGSFYSYGLNVGIFGLNLSVYNFVQYDSSLSSIEAKNYGLSYTFHF